MARHRRRCEAARTATAGCDQERRRVTVLVLSRDDARVYDFNERTGNLTEPRPLVAGLLIRGQAGTLGTERVVLYRGAGNQLEIRRGHEVIQIADSTRVEFTSGRTRVLRLLVRSSAVLTVQYEFEGAEADLVEDLTPFTEEEDQDFGLFIAEVLRDAGRRRRIFMSPV